MWSSNRQLKNPPKKSRPQRPLITVWCLCTSRNWCCVSDSLLIPSVGHLNCHDRKHQQPDTCPDSANLQGIQTSVQCADRNKHCKFISMQKFYLATNSHKSLFIPDTKCVFLENSTWTALSSLRKRSVSRVACVWCQMGMGNHGKWEDWPFPGPSWWGRGSLDRLCSALCPRTAALLSL